MGQVKPGEFRVGRSAGPLVDLAGLGLVPRILFATDGTITHILEAYAGELIDLVRLDSSMMVDVLNRRELGIEPGERALRRLSLLRGRESRSVFVHADSVVVLDRLPEGVADDLVNTGTSLLKLLSGQRIGTFRESIGEWTGTAPNVSAYFDLGPSEVLVARTYQVVIGGRPVAWITESFPRYGFSSVAAGLDPGR